MGELIYNGLSVIFGSTMIDSIDSWMTKILDILQNSFAEIFSNDAFHFLQIMAVSLLIINYFWDLSSQASRDMITLEKLVSSLVRLFIGVAILLYLPDLLDHIFKLGAALYHVVHNSAQERTMQNITIFGQHEWPEYEAEINFNGSKTTAKELIEQAFGKFSITNFISNLYCCLLSLIMMLLCMIAKIAGYLLITSNAVNLIIRAFIAPIGVVNIFDDSSRSSGVRYLKKFAAAALTFAAMSLALWGTSVISENLLASTVADAVGSAEITPDNLKKLFSLGTMVEAVVIQFAGIGALAAVKTIADDAMGA